MSKKRFAGMAALVLILALVISGRVMAESSAGADTGTEEVSWRDYNGKKIGVLTGTLFEGMAKKFFPDSEHLYFNSYTDCNAALLAGKIDAFLGDEPGMKMIHAEQPSIDYIHDRISDQDCAFAFRKNDEKSAALCAEFNEFLAGLKADGTLDELADKWLGAVEDKKVLDMSGLTATKGTIKVITTSSDMPWSYIKDGKNVGYDIDILAAFCKEKGYGLELFDMDFSARIPALQSGKYDLSTDMNVTEERKEQVLFSNPTYKGGVVLAVLATDLEKGTSSFIDEVKSSFYKTFIREDRYKLFLSGIFTTVLITLLAIIFGTVLGFLIYMGCRKGNRAANLFAKAFVWLVQGMPVVVLLMILYYIIFAKTEVSGVAVAVIAFTLVFGSGVYGMITSGVGAVDSGQSEAAFALGFGDITTFFSIILPQAAPHFLPAFKSEVVSLVKATAIVGYVAVQDLTRMGDIVRGRTYEAFFPLIAVAVIYFILGGLLRLVIGRIEKLADPKKRDREAVLKGVRRRDRD